MEKVSDPTLSIAFENHHYGVTPEKYTQFGAVLADWYTILSTTKDREGIRYVSSMEGNHFPFFGEFGPISCMCSITG